MFVLRALIFNNRVLIFILSALIFVLRVEQVFTISPV